VISRFSVDLSGLAVPAAGKQTSLVKRGSTSEVTRCLQPMRAFTLGESCRLQALEFLKPQGPSSEVVRAESCDNRGLATYNGQDEVILFGRIDDRAARLEIRGKDGTKRDIAVQGGAGSSGSFVLSMLPAPLREVTASGLDNEGRTLETVEVTKPPS
jgi:hypothetical protein